MRRDLTYVACDWADVVDIKSRATEVARVGMAAEEAEEPIEQAARRRDAVGVAIGTEERHF